jgi:hypothetical protein
MTVLDLLLLLLLLLSVVQEGFLAGRLEGLRVGTLLVDAGGRSVVRGGFLARRVVAVAQKVDILTRLLIGIELAVHSAALALL